LIFGEAEFIFASAKILAVIGVIILAIVLDLGGGPNHDRLGLGCWQDPRALRPYVENGDWGRFLGCFSTLISAAFSYDGIEMVAIVAGEAKNPRYAVIHPKT